jgi:hypothetical protein
MSGTHKMSKFELEEYVRNRLAEGVAQASTPPPPVAERPASPEAVPTESAEPDAVHEQETRRVPRAELPLAEAEHPCPPEAPEQVERAHHPPVRPPMSSGPAELKDEPSVEVAATPDGGVDALRTQLARKFTSLAEAVTHSFADFAIGSAAWAVELTPPTGPSTGGGKRALLHLILRPRRPGFQTLVGGLVNPVEKRAELRDFDHIFMVHELRFRAPLQITADEWEQFLRKAEVVLNGAEIRSQRVPPTKDLIEQSKRKPRVSRVAIAVLVVVLVLAAVVAWRVVHTLRG